MPLQFNAEGVVLLIAQGWRQPTLGYACSEEGNAVGVELFQWKHGYSEGIYGGLRLKSVTLMALKHLFSNTIKDNIRINKWRNVETF